VVAAVVVAVVVVEDLVATSDGTASTTQAPAAVPVPASARHAPTHTTHAKLHPNPQQKLRPPPDAHLADANAPLHHLQLPVELVGLTAWHDAALEPVPHIGPHHPIVARAAAQPTPPQTNKPSHDLAARAHFLCI